MSRRHVDILKGAVEKYKDGLCVKCWIEENKHIIERNRIILQSKEYPQY